MQPFYIVAYEAGADHSAVPTWASAVENPLSLKGASDKAPSIRHIESVPSSFQVLNLLSPLECGQMIKEAEVLGFCEDAAISLPRTVRHNQSLVWVVDEATHDIIWKRCEALMETELFGGKKPLGLNRRFRFYKYEEGDFFKAHTDGSWPGSAVVDKKLIRDAYGDRQSRMTFLIFLSDGFIGGETQFFVDKNDSRKAAKRAEDVKRVDIQTPSGAVLCFPHGSDSLHCMHASTEILSGLKYVIRTDILFAL